MRCPSCGTENAPDSRFCGGCGGKLGTTLAPTTKLPDDQAYEVRAKSIPPTVQRAASIPPTAPARALSVPPMAASPSLSMAAARPKRSGGLIALVLIADLGLATAGAVMLGKGLGHSKAEAKPETAPDPKPEAKPEAKPAELQKTEAAPPPAPSAPAPATPATGSAATAEPTGSDSVTAARKDDKTVKRHDQKAKPPTKPKKLVAPAGPVDPYAVDLGAEIDHQTTSSRPAFARCYKDATTSGALHGQIRIAFQILANGLVSHASAVDNTTGSDALASCLAGAINGWTFSAHAGEPIGFVRPFAYP